MFVLALPHDSSGYHFLFCRTRKQKVLHPDGLVRGRQTYAFPGSHQLFPGQTLQAAVAPKCFFFCFMQIFHSETQILFGSHMELCTLYPALGNTRWRARGCFPSVPALSSFADLCQSTGTILLSCTCHGSSVTSDNEMTFNDTAWMELRVVFWYLFGIVHVLIIEREKKIF